MEELARDLLNGTITATALHIVTQPDGFEAAPTLVFAEDPEGPISIEQENGSFVVGRYDTVTIQVPRRRIVAIEYTDPNGAGSAPVGGDTPRGRVIP